jgi:IMP dehydrogenase/GMP reductase
MKAPLTCLAALIASALFLAAPFQTTAQETKPKTEGKAKGKEEGKDKAKRDTYPYQGKVKSTDKTAMTITLEGKEKERVIGVTSETKFTKEGKPATFGDVATGENVRGQVKKTPEGKENAVSVFLGPVPEKKGGEKKEKKKE